MIIPELKLSNGDTAEQRVAQIRRWSLFGKLAITGAGPDSIEPLEQVLKLAGGLVDIRIELTNPNEDDAIKLLNAGAVGIVSNDPKRFSNVPGEHVVSIAAINPADKTGFSPGDYVQLHNPNATSIAELEMNRADAGIACGILEESPELIADFFQLVLKSDRPDGLWATVIVDPLGTALGLAYSNYESLLNSVATRAGTYWSRSRNGLWIKGKSSGATQLLTGVRMDCDRDCLRFSVVQQMPGFCHRDTYTCFGEERTIQSVMYRLKQRIDSADAKSFTKRLASDPKMLEAKLLEEAQELAEAATPHETAWEAADVLYFSLVAMLDRGVALEDVYHELARRMTRVVRRKNKLAP